MMRTRRLLGAAALAFGLAACWEWDRFGPGESGAGADAGEDGDAAGGAFRCVAEGGTGDGSSWAEALADLPAGLERGVVYYVAAGTYEAAELRAAGPGEDEVVVRRATVRDHGDEVGWFEAFAAGQAVFGPLTVVSPHVTLDGGPELGIRLVGTFDDGDHDNAVLHVGASDVTVRGLEVDGAFAADEQGAHARGACIGVRVEGDRVTVEGCLVHDTADDGVRVRHSTGLRLAGNRIHRIFGCGTAVSERCAGPCNDGRADGVELFDVDASEVSGNLVHDVYGSAALFFREVSEEPGPDSSEGLSIANNVFYAPETSGLVVYLRGLAGLGFFHNVVWGFRRGRFGGLALDDSVTDADLVNNVILSINYDHLGGTYDPEEHRGHHNLFGASLGQWADDPTDVVAADPGFVGVGDVYAAPVVGVDYLDFSLRPDSPCRDAGFPGDSVLPLPAVDALGNPRDESPDIGAIEL